MNVYNSLKSFCSICCPEGWKDWTFLAGGTICALTTKSYAVLGSVSAAYALYKYSGSSRPVQSDDSNSSGTDNSTKLKAKNPTHAGSSPTSGQSNSHDDSLASTIESVQSYVQETSKSPNPTTPATSKALCSGASSQLDSSRNLQTLSGSSSIIRLQDPFDEQIPEIVSSIGIPNRGSNCFLASMMQAKILKDPRLLQAFLDPSVREVLPNTQKFILQLLKDMRDGKQMTSASISDIRADLYAISGSPDWMEEQHDWHDAFEVLLTPKPIEEALARNGYGYEKNIRRYWAFWDEIKPLNIGYNQADDRYFTDQTELVHMEDICVTEDMMQPRIEDLLRSTDEKIENYVFDIEDKETGSQFKHEGVYLSTESQWKSPPMRLSINLKRYQMGNPQRGEPLILKVCTPVTVEDRIQLHGSLFQDGRQRTYELVSFIEHIGFEPNSGHYVAYVKEFGKWFCYNDLWKSEPGPEDFELSKKGACFYDLQLVFD